MAVQRGGTDRADSLHDNKDDAMDRGVDLAKAASAPRHRGHPCFGVDVQVRTTRHGGREVAARTLETAYASEQAAAAAQGRHGPTQAARAQDVERSRTTRSDADATTPPASGPYDPTHLREAVMQIDKTTILDFLQTNGQHDKAEQASQPLPGRNRF
jgi:hypothetical protein